MAVTVCARTRYGAGQRSHGQKADALDNNLDRDELVPSTYASGRGEAGDSRGGCEYRKTSGRARSEPRFLESLHLRVPRRTCPKWQCHCRVTGSTNLSCLSACHEVFKRFGSIRNRHHDADTLARCHYRSRCAAPLQREGIQPDTASVPLSQGELVWPATRNMRPCAMLFSKSSLPILVA